MAEHELTIVFDGTGVSCCAGDTVAAALTAADKLSLRETRDGNERGLYCGMGTCQECLVTVDGRPGQLACMTTVADGMTVQRNPHRAPLSVGAAPKPACDRVTAEPEVLVVGGGPGGLIAASVAAESGAEVVVLDERANVGGQFFKQPRSMSRRPLRLDRQFEDGRRLIERATRSGATLISNAQVVGAFANNELLVRDRNAVRVYRPQRLIIATGAYERSPPFPGWTLPGVMTIGAAQTLLRGHGVRPGQRILIAGNGPLNAQVAVELSKAGADVVSVLELAPVHRPRALKPILRMLATEPGLTTAGIRGLAQLRLAGVTLRSGCGIAAVESTAGGLRATFGQASSDGIQAHESTAVDAVCLGYGFLPNNELLRMLGCRHRYDAGRMQLIVERRDDCQTSLDGVFAIGDCCGLGGAVTAMHEGTIAATSVARSLGLDITNVADREEQRAKRRLARHSAFQAALWSLYAAPRFDTELATADTPICRCENVTLQQLDDALAEGFLSLAEIKRQTRLGMGSCQGRNCATIALSRLAGQTALTPDEYAFFAARAPLKPVRIGELVGPAAD